MLRDCALDAERTRANAKVPVENEVRDGPYARPAEKAQGGFSKVKLPGGPGGRAVSFSVMPLCYNTTGSSAERLLFVSRRNRFGNLSLCERPLDEGDGIFRER